MIAAEKGRAVRCAIYTRKSHEEGLDQAFNSLDAQREACEAYIASQRHEGWLCLPQQYDDGGFTGGNMDRPGLKALLNDIEAGRIDVVLVYKVDRLSRSLMDFSRLVALSEQHEVAFVSVTQRFDTTSSMGRLTLNILLSFAQFERELCGERIRDKIAGAKRKGKYVGGRPLLGYDVDHQAMRMVVNEPEARLVRHIFRRAVFYTPRPVVRFMVEALDPQLGETVLDPACGTGGFLQEAYGRLAKQVKTTKDHKVLQAKSIFGQEAKSLPYLLAQMNLLLHGLEYPQIRYGNSLAVTLTELGDADRVDVILTNPPFGGEEEAGILTNFPQDRRTSETSLLFLQLIMRKPRRPVRGNQPGRAAVVVPNGMLFGDGVCARIKGHLLTDFNLHTIVRLPNGVFAPYTSIPTNLLFFDRTGPTKDIWYYEIPLPEGRKNYTKTKPMQYEDFADCLAWFRQKRRKETDHAWRIPAANVLQFDDAGQVVSCNLDIKNPNSAEALELAVLLPQVRIAAKQPPSSSCLSPGGGPSRGRSSWRISPVGS